MKTKQHSIQWQHIENIEFHRYDFMLNFIVPLAIAVIDAFNLKQINVSLSIPCNGQWTCCGVAELLGNCTYSLAILMTFLFALSNSNCVVQFYFSQLRCTLRNWIEVIGIRPKRYFNRNGLILHVAVGGICRSVTNVYALCGGIMLEFLSLYMAAWVSFVNWNCMQWVTLTH